MERFTIPRDIYIGENSIEYLKKVKGKKAVIVFGSERLIKDGTIAKIQKNLKEANIDSELISGVEVDPSIETVQKGAKFMGEYKPDIIVAVGGGSPIDAAKAMWIFYEYPELSFFDIVKPFSLPELRKKATFYAIPTTSGTATEVTAFSVITDYSTGIKYPIADYNITPDVAILDYNLVQSMPKALVANTGMDAMTHAIEAYVSTVGNIITDSLALTAIESIFENLEKSFNGDLNAKNEMHLAQSLAGMSFSNAILGLVHSIAHKTGKIFGIDHGLANAIYLPYIIEYNGASDALEKYAKIAKRLNLKGTTDSDLLQELVLKIKELKKTLGIPNSLKEFGVSEEEFKAHLNEVAKRSLEDPCTGTNPRTTNLEEMKCILTAIYYGETIKF